jgi:hypothetical protein
MQANGVFKVYETLSLHVENTPCQNETFRRYVSYLPWHQK